MKCRDGKSWNMYICVVELDTLFIWCFEQVTRLPGSVGLLFVHLLHAIRVFYIPTWFIHRCVTTGQFGYLSGRNCRSNFLGCFQYPFSWLVLFVAWWIVGWIVSFGSVMDCLFCQFMMKSHVFFFFATFLSYASIISSMATILSVLFQCIFWYDQFLNNTVLYCSSW
jgi:hypothetical protein